MKFFIIAVTAFLGVQVHANIQTADSLVNMSRYYTMDDGIMIDGTHRPIPATCIIKAKCKSRCVRVRQQ